MAFPERKFLARALALSALLELCCSAGALAATGPIPSPSPSPSSSQCPVAECNPPTHTVSFTLSCRFLNNSNPTGYKNCLVSSTFTKAVTLDGGEVVDDSVLGDDPTFVLNCDGNVLYNDHSYRSTGIAGTIIRGESGPYPSFTLDRGELHDGNHVASSFLSVNLGSSMLTTPGMCQISVSP